MAEFLTHHRKKLFIVFLISVLLMLGLCAQLGFLMIARSDHYSKMADELHKRERTIKAARGEIVDDEAILAALDTGRVAVYVTDFPNNRLLTAPHVIAMPHLGASTPESEQNCAAMAVDTLRAG